MKTLVKTLVAAALLAISTLSMASVDSDKKVVNLSTANLALDHYLDVTTEGQSLGLEQLFNADFNQKTQGQHAKTNSRYEVIEFYKKQKGEKLNCKTTTQVIEATPDYVVAKVIMQFDSFTKCDLVTLINESGIWKVTGSVTSYR